MTYAVNQAYTPMVNALGSGPTFYFFAAVCVLSFAWIHVYLFETRGRTLEEIQELLKGGKAGGAGEEQGDSFSLKALAKQNA